MHDSPAPLLPVHKRLPDDPHLDRQSLDDSSTENRPSNIAAPARRVLYAPPPSPSRSHPPPEDAHLLPSLVSNVLITDDPVAQPAQSPDSLETLAAAGTSRALHFVPHTPPPLQNPPSTESSQHPLTPPTQPTDSPDHRVASMDAPLSQLHLADAPSEEQGSGPSDTDAPVPIQSVPLDPTAPNPFDPVVEPVDSNELLADPLSIRSSEPQDADANTADDAAEPDLPSSSSLLESLADESGHSALSAPPVASSVSRKTRKRLPLLAAASVLLPLAVENGDDIAVAATDFVKSLAADGKAKEEDALSPPSDEERGAGSSDDDRPRELHSVPEEHSRSGTIHALPVADGKNRSCAVFQEYSQLNSTPPQEQRAVVRAIPSFPEYPQPARMLSDDEITSSPVAVFKYPQPEQLDVLPLIQTIPETNACFPTYNPQEQAKLGHANSSMSIESRMTSNARRDMDGIRLSQHSLQPMLEDQHDPDAKRLATALPARLHAEESVSYGTGSSHYPSFSSKTASRSSRSGRGSGYGEGSSMARDAEGDPYMSILRKREEMEARRRRRKEDSAMRSRKHEGSMSSTDRARLGNLTDTHESANLLPSEYAQRVGTMAGRERGEGWTDAASDSDHDIFFDARSSPYQREVHPASSAQHSSERRQSSRHGGGHSHHEDAYYAEASPSDDECPGCLYQQSSSHDHEASRKKKSKSRSRAESSKRRLEQSGYDSGSDGVSEHHSSRSRSEKRSGGSHRSDRTDHSSRDRSHRTQKSSSRERRGERLDRSERSGRSDRSERTERREKSEGSDNRDRSGRSEVLSRSERDHGSRRTRSATRKHSHERDRSRSHKGSRDEDPERRKRDPKSKSKKKHRRGPSVPSIGYSNSYTNAKSVYRHVDPESDSGVDNPIPWYWEGQSAPEDTDPEDALPSRHSGLNSTSDTPKFSSYGRRDKNGRRRKAHHNRRVTFLYDDL